MLALLAAALPAAADAQAAAPVATTGPAESITDAGATLTGTVDRRGGTTTYHFEYGTSAPAYGLRTVETAVPAGGTDPVTGKAPIQGLTRDTTYHYRLVATNESGASQGADQTFRSAPQAPAVGSTRARDVGTRGARLVTTADPNGQETSVHFEYGTSTRYGTSTESVSAGSGDEGVPISIPLGGLLPHTRYHFTAVATSASGSARSVDRTFLTLREPTGVSIAALTPTRVLWGSGITILGRVLGTGLTGTPIAVETQAFPFQAAFGQVGPTRAVPRDGSFRFDVPSLFVTSRVRVVTRSKIVVASASRTVWSAVKVTATARARGKRRERIQGTIWPRLPSGRVSLQERTRRGGWALARRVAAKPLGADRSRYSFTVTRAKRAARYRVLVLARDGGGHLPGRSRVLRVPAARR
jgi:hypothetical protein